MKKAWIALGLAVLIATASGCGGPAASGGGEAESGLGRGNTAGESTPGEHTAEMHTAGESTAEAFTDGERTAETFTDGERTAETFTDGERTAETFTDGERTAETFTDGKSTAGESTASSTFPGASVPDETQTPSVAPANEDLNRRQIKDQSFDTALYGWGDVTFAAYLPLKNEEEDEDASFKLLKDGIAIYSFPGRRADNRRPGKHFSQVEAVAFKDYDEDGKTDIVLILKYKSYPASDEEFREVRLYTQSGGGKDFSIDRGLDDFLMTKHYDGSIRSIMEGITEYRHDRDLMALSIDGLEKQIKVLADHRELWCPLPEYDSSRYCAVTDLDQNGRLELITSSTQGSSFYTYSTFFEINESLDGLDLCEYDKKALDSEADIIEASTPVFYDPQNHVYHYIFY